MIRYVCPACNSILESPDRKIGDKINCPKCSQRVQVPNPSKNKTVLGKLLPGNETISGGKFDAYAAQKPTDADWHIAPKKRSSKKSRQSIDPQLLGLIPDSHVDNNSQSDSDAGSRSNQKTEWYRDWNKANDYILDMATSKSAAKKRVLAGFLLTAGFLESLFFCCGAVYYWIIFNPSIESSMGGRIMNLGLMQDRQNGIIVCLALMFPGVLCFFSGLIIATNSNSRIS